MARTRKLRRAFVARITRGTLVAWLCLQPQRGLRAEEPTSNPNAPLPAITGNLEADQIQSHLHQLAGRVMTFKGGNCFLREHK